MLDQNLSGGKTHQGQVSNLMPDSTKPPSHTPYQTSINSHFPATGPFWETIENVRKSKKTGGLVQGRETECAGVGGFLELKMEITVQLLKFLQL